jgi:hypothetical protein
MAVRKSAFINIGGMDETTTEPGECGEIEADNDAVQFQI